MNKNDLVKLSKTLSLPTNKLLSSEKGRYAGQWTIYALVYGIRALYNNIDKLITKNEYLQLATPIIDNIMSKDAIRFDSKYWSGSIDEMQLDDLEKDHLAAISIRAWALQMHSEQDESYKTLYETYLNALIDRYERNEYDFLRINKHNYTRFIPDNLLAISVIDNSKYHDIAGKIMDKANLNFDKPLPKVIRCRKVSGSYCALSTYYLSLFKDKSMANSQWNVIKNEYFNNSGLICGINESKDNLVGLSIDKDGGPVINGISIIGTCFSVAPARMFDNDIAKKFIKEGEFVAKIVKNTSLRNYLPVGLSVFYSMISE